MSKEKIGIDSANFILKSEGLRNKCGVNKLEFINPLGNKYGSAVIKENQAEINICLPKYLRSTNVEPFTASDMEIIDEIRIDVLNTLGMMGEVLYEFRLKSIECNLTLPVNDQCDCNQVLNLLKTSFNKVFVCETRSTKHTAKKDIESIYIPSKNYYALKVYNKGREQNDISSEDKLMRFETVFLDRCCTKLFGDKNSIEDILQRDSLLRVFEQYRHVFIDEVKTQIKKSLTNICNTLVESLMITDSPLGTLACYHDIIVDQDVFRQALKRWYRMKGKADCSRQVLHGLKGYDLPKGVLKTIKAFSLFCE